MKIHEVAGKYYGSKKNARAAAGKKGIIISHKVKTSFPVMGDYAMLNGTLVHVKSAEVITDQAIIAYQYFTEAVTLADADDTRWPKAVA